MALAGKLGDANAEAQQPGEGQFALQFLVERLIPGKSHDHLLAAPAKHFESFGGVRIGARPSSEEPAAQARGTLQRQLL